MNYDLFLELLNKKKDVIDFGEYGKGIDDSLIEKAERRLNVKFPPSYKWWLKKFDGGEIHGEEIFSIYGDDFDNIVGGDIVYMNELNRKNGINSNDELVVQENDQGEVYFFDLTRCDDQGEYPIICDVNNDIYSQNFIEFLIKKINE